MLKNFMKKYDIVQKCNFKKYINFTEKKIRLLNKGLFLLGNNQYL